MAKAKESETDKVEVLTEEQGLDNPKRVKWPAKIWLVRHAQSKYNILKEQKANSELYQEFKEGFDHWSDFIVPFMPSQKLLNLAMEVKRAFSLGCSDRKTDITKLGEEQARQTGLGLAKTITEKPDVIIVSPYLRAKKTLDLIRENCPILQGVPELEDERIREQDHGLSLIYNDWRLLQVFHPEQKALRDLIGQYDYRYPNGENVVDVRTRSHRWFDKLIRDFAGKKVFVVTHHLTILAIRGLLCNWTAEQFMKEDENNKPDNCGVTLYDCDPNQGKNGKLIETFYNQVHWEK